MRGARGKVQATLGARTTPCVHGACSTAAGDGSFLVILFFANNTAFPGTLCPNQSLKKKLIQKIKLDNSAVKPKEH